MSSALAILAAILYIIPYFKPDLFLISFFSFLPLLFALEGEEGKRTFFFGWLMGIGILAGTGYWLYFPLADFSDLSMSVVFLILFTTIIIGGLYFGLWSLIHNFMQPKHSFSPFIFAFSWTGFEFIRYYWLNIYPFGYLGYSQFRNKWVLQFASYGGVLLVSFVVALVAGYLFKIIKKNSMKRMVPLLILILVIAIVGNLPSKVDGNNYLKVGIIPTEFNQEDKWRPEFVNQIVEKIGNAADQLTGADLIITPETSLTFDLIKNEFYREMFFNKIEKVDSYLVVGSRAIKDGDSDRKEYNSNFLLAPGGKVIDRYDKQKPLIFGEYIPFANFVERLTGYAIIPIFPGDSDLIFSTQRFSWLNLICSEILDPVSKKVAKNYQFIANQSNEAWFGDANLQIQMWGVSVFRAVESRKSVVRAGNQAISGYISPLGNEIVMQQDNNSPFMVNIILNQKTTFYQRKGELIGIIITLLALLIFIIKFILYLRKLLINSASGSM